MLIFFEEYSWLLIIKLIPSFIFVLFCIFSLKERPISPTPGPIGHQTPNLSSIPSSSPNQNIGSPMNIQPCPGGTAGLPQQQPPMINSQGVQPPVGNVNVFRPNQPVSLHMYIYTV